MTDLDSSILSCLRSARASLNAVQIAKSVGLVSAKDVNPTLYRLAKLDKISHDGQPPVWRLSLPTNGAGDTTAREIRDSASWAMRQAFDERACESPEASGEEMDNLGSQGNSGNIYDMEVATDFTRDESFQFGDVEDVPLPQSNISDSVMLQETFEDMPPPQSVRLHASEGSAALNDQVRLLRALSTSDDDQDTTMSSLGNFAEKTASFNIGRSDANSNVMSQENGLLKRILQNLSVIPKQHCSTLRLLHSLQLGCKSDLNHTLYEMSKCDLIRKVNDTPPHWQIAPAGHCLLHNQAVGRTPEAVFGLSSKASSHSKMIQSENMNHMLGVEQCNASAMSGVLSKLTIPLSPAEMIKCGYGAIHGASSEMHSKIHNKIHTEIRSDIRYTSSYSLGVRRVESIVSQRVGIGRGIHLVQCAQNLQRNDSERLLGALKVPSPTPDHMMPSMNTGAQNTQEALLSLSSESFAALNKHPVSALMEFAQKRNMRATIELFGQAGASHIPSFRMAAVVDGRQFPYMTAPNKKDAKTEAAEVAVRILMSEEQIKVSHSPVKPQASLCVPATHFDKMAALCHQAFHLVLSGVAISMAGRKVMAGVVMKNGAGDNGKVVSLGSGNRCITGEDLSMEGHTVNDSHAEIIARRGFLRFLCRNLQAHKSGDPQSIFEETTNGMQRVKPDTTFHLYITTAPCGDGALMSRRDSKPLVGNDDGIEHHPIFSSGLMGLLRTKIEGGEGTHPIKPDFAEQTWDGIVRGERLRTMSCSDKICRWNIVGMQGALLSHFIEPIYLSSLTLGFLYEESHLSRAVCCRLVHGEPDITPQLHAPYHVNHPQLGRVTICDQPRETQKTKHYSVNWCEGDSVAEVTDGTKGIGLDGKLSQVCKSALYKDFKMTCEKLGRADLLRCATYLDAKQSAKEFQDAKRLMVTKFKGSGYGMWVSKPIEEKMFS